MKPNLKSYNTTSLVFHTTMALPNDLISEIRNISPPDEDGDSSFVDSYQRHNASVWVIEVDKGPDKEIRRFNVVFNYELGRGRKLGKRIPKIEQIIDILSSIGKENDFDCRVAFEFGRRLKPKPIIALPVKYMDFPNMPFDRIEGVHLVKLDGAETKYDVILEALGRGVITESVFFKYTSEIDKSLADKILSESMTISDRFVFKEQ